MTHYLRYIQFKKPNTNIKNSISIYFFIAFRYTDKILTPISPTSYIVSIVRMGRNSAHTHTHTKMHTTEEKTKRSKVQNPKTINFFFVLL